MDWSVVDSENVEGDAAVTLELKDEPYNRAMWDFSFQALYKNKERTELPGRISLFCWMGSSVCTTLVEVGELGTLSASMKKLEKDLKNTDKYQNEHYH